MAQFTLSHIVQQDVVDLTEMLQDPIIHQNTLVIPNPYTLDDGIWYINYCSKLYKKWDLEGRSKSPLHQAIRNEQGRMIGNISLEYKPATPSTPARAVLGYYLHKDYRGKGIMPNAVKQMLKHAFSPDWDIEKVDVATFASNKSSGRVVEKVGFAFLGFEANKYTKTGMEGGIDANNFVLLKNVLGYYLHKDYRGKGIMPAATRQMLSYAFSNDWDIEKVDTSTFALNKSSGRALEKSGFVFKEFVAGKYAKKGAEVVIDAKMYSLSKMVRTHLRTDIRGRAQIPTSILQHVDPDATFFQFVICMKQIILLSDIPSLTPMGVADSGL
ncbi:UNVERIFIED_CONTAM: hypothetical protein HDU68_000171 [Siphonaria sp. JEL0065]|nr:hypothetical protein HDU68_000171 [Siphonaria sp. JEL0065]